MRSLLSKELRRVLPFMLLQAIIFLSGTITSLLFRFPDQLDMDSVVGYVRASSTDDYTLMAFLVTMALAAGLIVGEKDRGTLEFLDSLPTTRSRVFLAKMIAGWTVLALAPVLEVTAGIAMRALSRSSLDHSFHLDIMLAGGFCHLSQLLLLFGLALNLAYLRRFAWLVAAVMISTYLVMVDRIPALGVFDVAALCQPVFSGTERKIPVSQLQVLLPLAVVFHASAWISFAAGADRLLGWLETFRDTRRGRALFAIAGAASVIAWITAFALMYRGDEEKAESEIPGATFREAKETRTSTEHYRFTYSSDRARRARRLIDAAERVHEQVRSRFEVAAIDLIEVDATRELAQHGMAGLADWKQIQIDLDAVVSSTRAIEILAHETSHAYIAKASNRRFNQAHSTTRFFNEGLAQVTGAEIAGDLASLEEHTLRAALMKHRKQLSLEVLLDDAELTRTHDETLAYSLGVELVSAVRDRWGPKAPYAVVRAFGREKAPEDLRGIVLWRDAFQAAGYDFDEALARFYERLDRTRKTERKLLDAIPRAQVVLQKQDTVLIVRAAWTPEPISASDNWNSWSGFGPARLICRFRPGRDSSPSDVHTMYAEQGTCSIPSALFREGAAHVQLGVQLLKQLPLYEPWVEIPLTD